MNSIARNGNTIHKENDTKSRKRYIIVAYVTQKQHK